VGAPGAHPGKTVPRGTTWRTQPKALRARPPKARAACRSSISRPSTTRSSGWRSDIAAAEDLKLKAEEAEKAYNQAIVDARAEAAKIIAEARAEIQADLDEATARADAEIAGKTAESEKRIGEIRASALDSVTKVAQDTAAALVAALGGAADDKAVSAAVTDRMKG